MSKFNPCILIPYEHMVMMRNLNYFDSGLLMSIITDYIETEECDFLNYKSSFDDYLTAFAVWMNIKNDLDNSISKYHEWVSKHTKRDNNNED